MKLFFFFVVFERRQQFFVALFGRDAHTNLSKYINPFKCVVLCLFFFDVLFFLFRVDLNANQHTSLNEIKARSVHGSN